MSFEEFKQTQKRIQQDNGYEKFIEYYYYDNNGNMIAWIRKECRLTKYNNQAAKGTTYINCKTLEETLQKAYELTVT